MTPRITLDPGASALLEALRAAGHRAYAVGGCVRDSLLGKAPADWDLCTSARPEQVLGLFGPDRCIPTGLKHGTVTVRQGAGLYEITTFRVEGAYSDGRHPDHVEFVPDVALDLARRDFTINAMAYHPEEGLIDPFGGQADLAAGVVRAVGDPTLRFTEDGLRILRLFRFAAREGFAVDPASRAAALALRGRLSGISAERVLQELEKLLLAPRPGRWMEPLLFEALLPELDPCGQPERFDSCCREIDAAPADLPVRLAALFSPLGPPDEAARQAETALRRLRASNRLLRQVSQLTAESALTAAKTPDARRVQARHLLARLGAEQARRLVCLRRAQTGPAADWEAFARVLEALIQEDACCRVGQLAIGGQELRALGIPAGPELGRTLAALLEQVLDEKLPNQRQALLEAARALSISQPERQEPSCIP